MSITAGINLGFKRGTQAALDAIINNGNNSATPGSFYLTDDTHRLYVGNDDHSLSPVNEGITFVSALTDLPTLTAANKESYQGQFYYVSGANILCVASGLNWVQINPDTYYMLSQRAGANNFTLTSSTDNNTGVTTVNVTTNIVEDKFIGGEQQTETNSARAQFSFQIEAAATAGMTVDSVNKKITFAPPAGAVYTLDGPATDVSGDTGVTLTLTGSNNTSYPIVFAQGNGGVTPHWNATTKTLTLDGGGLQGATYTIAADTTDSNKIVLTLQDAAGNRASADIKPIIHYGSDGTTSTESAVGTYDSTNHTLEFTLDTYTTDEIDDKIQESLNSVDGLYFAGTIGTSGTYANFAALASDLTNLQSGAFFKICSDMEAPVGITLTGLGGKTDLQAGDVIIVSGPEDANGDLTGQSVVYHYIPSGDDEDLYYQPNLEIDDHQRITFELTNGSTSTATHRVNFAAGNNGVVISGREETGTAIGENQTLLVSHKTLAAAPADTPATAKIQDISSNTNDTYTAITGLSFDDYGHVTGYQTQQITFTSNKLDSIRQTVTDSSANGVSSKTITTKYIDLTGQQKDDNSLVISSSSLVTSIDNTGATGANPAAISINLVWGSFTAPSGT